MPDPDPAQLLYTVKQVPGSGNARRSSSRESRAEGPQAVRHRLLDRTVGCHLPGKWFGERQSSISPLTLYPLVSLGRAGLSGIAGFRVTLYDCVTVGPQSSATLKFFFFPCSLSGKNPRHANVVRVGFPGRRQPIAMPGKAETLVQTADRIEITWAHADFITSRQSLAM